MKSFWECYQADVWYFAFAKRNVWVVMTQISASYYLLTIFLFKMKEAQHFHLPLTLPIRDIWASSPVGKGGGGRDGITLRARELARCTSEKYHSISARKFWKVIEQKNLSNYPLPSVLFFPFYSIGLQVVKFCGVLTCRIVSLKEICGSRLHGIGKREVRWPTVSTFHWNFSYICHYSIQKVYNQYNI